MSKLFSDCVCHSLGLTQARVPLVSSMGRPMTGAVQVRAIDKRHFQFVLLLLKGNYAVCKYDRMAQPGRWRQSELQGTPLRWPVVRSLAIWKLSSVFQLFCSLYISICCESVCSFQIMDKTPSPWHCVLLCVNHCELYLLEGKKEKIEACCDRPQCSMTCIFRLYLWPPGPVQRSCTSTRGKEWGHVSCHYLNLVSLHQCFLVGFLFKVFFLSQVAN